MSREESTPASAPPCRHLIQTETGSLLVSVRGARNKPALFMYHDLALNASATFTSFLNYPDAKFIENNFCVYLLNAPGQEDGAPNMPTNYKYPTMDDLAIQIVFVVGFFGIRSFVGLGVGFGANVLVRFALQYPKMVNSLILINCVSTVAGWSEWMYQKWNSYALKSKGMTQGVVDYFLWHHLNHSSEERNFDLNSVYKNHFIKEMNPLNLAYLIDCYIARSDLNFDRPEVGKTSSVAILKSPVLNICGSLFPYIDETVTLNGRLDPTKSTWLKICDCSLPLEEQPGKVAEALKLFLQGEESRTHGVGYYDFSSDEAERYKQQSELKKRHKETEEAQKKAAAARAARDIAMQKRVAAARARQRVRAGLPPEEEEKKTPSITEKLLDFVEEQKRAFAQKAEEEAKKQREEAAQKLREDYVREWDVGKEGLAKKQEMTQEEWVDKKRKERIDEFAPTEKLASGSKKSNKKFDKKGFVQHEDEVEYEEENRSLFFTTKKRPIKKQYYDPSVNEASSSSFTPTPIVDECENERVKEVYKEPEVTERRQGAEIEPPLTYEYYGPAEKKIKRNIKEDQRKVCDAFEQGVRYLEEQTESRHKQKNRAIFDLES